MIRVAALAKAFGPVRAVQGVSFEAPDGRVTGLLGPNGAGKTTTLRVIAGLVVPDGGQVTVDGHDVAREPELARGRLGLLPDARGLYPRLTARENVGYFAELHGLRGAALAAAVDRAIAALGLGEVADRRVQGFSNGERAKVALARAVVHDPRNVVLDEPTNGLDVMSIRAVRRVIAGFREQGKCVIFSSHVMQEVSAVCDHVVVVAQGRVVAQGTVAELLAQSGRGDLEEAFVTLVGAEAGEGAA